MKRSRSNIIALITPGLCALLLALPPLASADGDGGAPDPDSAEFVNYVMTKIDDQYRGEKSYGVMQMKVQTVNWTRTMELETWTLGKDYSLMRILSPKKDKGTATLKAKKDLFTYLSKTGKTIKVTSGMMGSSWMGSHFTNDDIVQDSRFSEDYTVKKTFTGEASGTEIHRFTLIPKAKSAVVWGKVVISVRASDLQPLRVLYYDEDMKKNRVLKFSNHKVIAGKVRPMKMVMKPLDGSGEYTRVLWKKIDTKVKLKKSFFTLQKLKSL